MKFSVQSRTRALLSAAVTAALAASGAVAVSPALAATAAPAEAPLLQITEVAPDTANVGGSDAYEFIVHPRLAGHGPTLFAGLAKHVRIDLVGRQEFRCGAVALRYVPRA